MHDIGNEAEEEEAAVVAAFVRKEVGDWDDEAKSRARFKALSGQRSDWEPLYLFWRNLIIKVARHLGTFIINPSHVKCLWFRRAGLFPLCLDRVLVEMHRAGDLLSPSSSAQPTSSSTSRLSYIFRRALDIFGSTGSDHYSIDIAGDYYILAPLLEERAVEVINILSENHWTSSCVLTMRKFRDICLGSKEALAILSYLSVRGRAKRLTIKRADPIEGVKVCLAPGAISDPSSTDYSILHLLWTAENLEQQLDLIDQRYQKTRNSALASLKSGNKNAALRYAKELKLSSMSRERCTGLLDRVENVIQVITDAESSTKVSEAIQKGSHAIKENQITVEEVEQCLQEVDENIDSLKRLDNALESTAAYVEIDDEDVEVEFNKLQLEFNGKTSEVPTRTGRDSHAVEAEASLEADALSNALSNLSLKKDSAGMVALAECSVRPSDNKSTSTEGRLEAA